MRQQAQGIFGGTFDPVHFGHLRAAIEARERLDLEAITFVPAGTPPHRDPPRASAGHRLNMLRVATGDRSELVVDDREVRRGGVSYMVDTLQGLRADAPTMPLLLLIGQDAANALDSWHCWRRLFDLAHIVIMRRPDSRHRYSAPLSDMIQPRLVASAEFLRTSSAGCVLPLEVTQLDISSTRIRDIIASGGSPGFLLPDAVIDYIGRHRLYRGSG